MVAARSSGIGAGWKPIASIGVTDDAARTACTPAGITSLLLGLSRGNVAVAPSHFFAFAPAWGRAAIAVTTIIVAVIVTISAVIVTVRAVIVTVSVACAMVIIAVAMSAAVVISVSMAFRPDGHYQSAAQQGRNRKLREHFHISLSETRNYSGVRWHSELLGWF